MGKRKFHISLIFIVLFVGVVFGNQAVPPPAQPPPGFPVDAFIVLLSAAGLILGITVKSGLHHFLLKNNKSLLPLLLVLYTFTGHAEHCRAGSAEFLGAQNRIWLNLLGHNGEMRQILIGFYDHTTDYYDPGYDVPKAETGGSMDFYSLIKSDTRRFSIQALGTFSNDKVITLGMDIVDTGSYHIEIDHVEGIFEEGQSIFLFDEYTGEKMNLTQSSYAFSSTNGHGIDDRFKIGFVPEINMDISDVSPSDEIVVSHNARNIEVSTLHHQRIDRVELYTLEGKKIAQTSSSDEWVKLELSACVTERIYLVVVFLNNGKVLSRKEIFY